MFASDSVLVATDIDNIEQIVDHPVICCNCRVKNFYLKIKTSVNPRGLASLTNLTTLNGLIGLTHKCQHSGFGADTGNNI